MSDTNYTLAELIIAAASEVWRGEGEVLATGIGLLPRLAASLSMSSSNPLLMMTDSEAYMVSEPVPVGPRGDYQPKFETWMGFSRVFDNVWSGKRHALVGPTQIDRFGQANISAIGGTYARPKVMMLGVRGFPGNSISHRNSFFVPNHSRQVFVEGEVDVVCSVGYNPSRLPRGYTLDDIKIGSVITNLCVFDFGGPDKQARLLSLHPGVTREQVQDNTGFELLVEGVLPTTPAPTAQQLELIAKLDPHNMRAKALG